MKTINTVLKIGTEDKASELTNFRIILTNSIALLSTTVHFFYAVLFVLRLQYIYAIFCSAGGLICLFCIYLNFINKQKIAAWVLLLNIGLIIITISIISGYDTQCHSLLVIISACSVLIFANPYSSAVYILSILVLFCFSYSYVDFHGALIPETKIPFSEFTNFGFSLICSFVFAKIVLKEVVDYIHSLKITLDELKVRNEEIKTKNEKLELFNTIAAHDLRTPVRNISSFIGLAKNKLDDPANKGKINEYLDIAHKSTTQMNALINSISQMSKINSTELIAQEMVNLNTLLDEVCQQVIVPLYPDAKINIEKLPYFYGNKAHFYTIFQNLLLNGLKYNDHNLKVIQVESELSKGSCHLMVRDNGIGIDKKYINQIFEPFSKLHSDSEFVGTGMGLFIVKEILQKYGSSINVKNSSNKGTTLILSFPRTILTST